MAGGLLALFVLAACAVPMKAAPPGRLETQAGFAVTLNEAWTRIPARSNPMTRGDVLTRDGLALNRLHIATLEPGEAFVRGEAAGILTCRAGMSALEQVEFLTTSLLRLGYGDIKVENVRPQDFDGVEGLRIDLSGSYQSGLNFRADAAIAQAGEQLHIVLFVAPAQYYYAETAGQVSEIIASADFK